MAFKNIKGNTRNSLLDYFVSGKAVQYHSNQFGTPILVQGLTATGGVISDYVDGSDVYRAHIFTSSGTFEVTEIGAFGDTVEYLVVAGGGGGGSHMGGGGGAGGLLSNHPDVPAPKRQSAFPVSVSPYPVVIGGGGSGDNTSGQSPPQTGVAGGTSSFGPVSTSGGGGGGSGYSAGAAGGSAGGYGHGPGPGAPTTGTSPSQPTQGNAGGGSAGPHYRGGGGGGGEKGGEEAVRALQVLMVDQLDRVMVAMEWQ